MNSPIFINSRDNAFVKDLKKLSHGSTDYRKQQRVWVEGDHLVRAALVRGVQPEVAVFSETLWKNPKFGPLALKEYAQIATKNVVISDALFDTITTLESPARMGFVFAFPAETALNPTVASVILDRVQDAGNVGAAQCIGLWFSTGHCPQGHGGAVVAQGVARRNGCALGFAFDRGC